MDTRGGGKGVDRRKKKPCFGTRGGVKGSPVGLGVDSMEGGENCRHQ